MDFIDVIDTIGVPALALLVFAAVLIFMMVKSVPQGEEWTVERFGRYTRTMKPGYQRQCDGDGGCGCVLSGRGCVAGVL